ncbi:MAG: beta-Ala-His dipeptidase [Candidatus Bathyarchaeota archaeon]|nr:MAG: beta-Ala-His dipeptidase [Candidatus Bathyarchaeota archaeon]
MKGFEPEIVWSLFEKISSIPRCSAREKKLQGWIEEWAGENGVAFRKDEVGNILLYREPSQGGGDIPTLTLQGHQDMVCEKTYGSDHDFDRDSLKLRVDGGVLSADGTTLGADNGVGVAIAMAMMVEPGLGRHGRIEAVFTVEEETGLIGAIKMQPGFFTGKRMVNLDSEELGVIIVSSAGGGGTIYAISVEWEDPQGWEGLSLQVKGLLGGHSGVDIHLPRLNANKLVGDALKRVSERMRLRIIHIKGGTRGNAIPRSANCDFLVPEGRAGEAAAVLNKWDAGLDKSDEESLVTTLTEVRASRCMSEKVSQSVIALITEVHQGVVSWSPDIEGLVQTSNNLGIVRTEEDAVVIPISSRSSDAEDLERDREILRRLGESHGAQVEQRPGYPGWKSDPSSPFLGLVSQVYEAILGARPRVTGIHGGLECGFLSRLDPELQIVSVGPDIENPHSPQELVHIESVGRLYEVVKGIASSMGVEE